MSKADRLSKAEYAINNTYNKSTGKILSKILFGVAQRGKIKDEIAAYMRSREDVNTRDLQAVREKARENTVKS